MIDTHFKLTGEVWGSVMRLFLLLGKARRFWWPPAVYDATVQLRHMAGMASLITRKPTVC